MSQDFEAMKALLGGTQADDTSAGEELVRACADSVRREVRRQLGDRLRISCDSDAIEQDVLLAIWKVVRNGQEFESAEHLKAFLKGVVENKVYKAHRYCHQQRRNIDREVHLDQEKAPEPPALQPGPADELAEQDRWERWLDQQPSDLCEIAIALREGQTLADIAEARGVSVKTGRRARGKIRQSLSAIYPPPPAPSK